MPPEVQLKAPNLKLEQRRNRLSRPKVNEKSDPHTEPEAEFKLKLQAEPEPDPKLEPLSEPRSQAEPENSKKASDIL